MLHALIARAELGFTAETFNMHLFQQHSSMIEIYTQNLDDTLFAIAFKDQQIVTSSFGADQPTTLNNVLGNLPFNVAFQVFHEPIAYAKNSLATLKKIYDGKAADINLPLATSQLPAYTKKVLQTTSAIPLGYVTSYGLISKAVGGGPRAVGNIMAGNPFAPIVPCHRVVRADFSLGGYGFGLKAKIRLLSKEKRVFSCSKQIEVDGEDLMVFPVECVLKNFA